MKLGFLTTLDWARLQETVVDSSTESAKRKSHPVPAITAVGGARVVESLVNFNRIVAALVLILQLKGEESQVDILAGWCLNNPVAIFFVFVVMVAVLGVRVKVFHTSRRLKVSAANYFQMFKCVYICLLLQLFREDEGNRVDYRLREWLGSRDAERKNQI